MPSQHSPLRRGRARWLDEAHRVHQMASRNLPERIKFRDRANKILFAER